MPKKILIGKVLKISGKNTISVEVEREVLHHMYNKLIKKTKKYKAHVERENQYKAGDVVSIIEHRPISKTKHWLVIEKSGN